jgi:hypothetical protein
MSIIKPFIKLLINSVSIFILIAPGTIALSDRRLRNTRPLNIHHLPGIVCGVLHRAIFLV